MAQPKKFNFKLDSITSLILVAFFLLGIYFIIQGLYNIFYYTSPILLIGALLIDHKTITGFGKWTLKVLKSNPIAGIGIILLSIIAFPFLFAFLFGKALFMRKFRKVQQDFEEKVKGDYIEYEEIPNTRTRHTNHLDLPPLKHKEPEIRNSDYEQLFDED